MPELPEVEITARRLSEALTGAAIESAQAPGVNTLKSVESPLESLEGQQIIGVRRRGKHLILDTDAGVSLLIHLMSAGRLQLYEQAAPPRSDRQQTARRDRTLRLLLRLTDGRELRLREFGTRQAAWAKLALTDAVEQEPSVSRLGPEAWPDPPELAGLLDLPRPLHALIRDQRVISGIGRSWADEILWEASLSPFKRGAALDGNQLGRLRDAMVSRLGGALEHYERHVRLPIPERLPMPLQVHGRKGGPCPRCGRAIEAVHFEDYVIAYCPHCQTEGQVLNDRRLSRLLR